MDYSTTTHPPRFRVTVEGERFTCEEAQGLDPRDGRGVPDGRDLTVTLTGCVLTDAPDALSWALAEEADGPRPVSVTIDETDATGREVLTTWQLTDAAPAQLQGAETREADHEGRIRRLTLDAARITAVPHAAGTSATTGVQGASAPADRR
ncbi:hypothetical protein [Streptomyces sp. H27-H5]|uniref:hypothetical protein n=1 Tax=Streptomyces sp. H27-H5 TaxID=2996460 RepID=UPI00226DAFDC|nr:hypothetical protein [Streptomyces sp. H27-H5]MCY0957370.1 hypothetical protein [Streptomyces sp. H27-H5]